MLLILLSALVPHILSLYSSNSPVVQLTSSNFKSQVVKSDEIWLVEFYAPWCGHCKNLVPEWEKAAKALKGIIKIGAVDVTTNEALGSQYGIKGFPTIKLFGSNKDQPSDYNSGRDATSITNFALQEAKKVVSSRLGGKSQGQKSANSSTGSVIVVDDSNYRDVLLDEQQPVFLEVYAPWCGHCKNLQPHYDQLPSKVQGVKIMKYDGDANKELASQLGVRGFPSLFFFPGGKKNVGQAQSYDGARDVDGMVSFLQTEAKKYQKAKFNQLLTQENFEEVCKDASACFVAFVPDLMENTVQERNQYLKHLKEVADKNKSSNIAFFWAQGGDQYELEEQLGLGFGYPSMIALSLKRKAYTVMKMSFTKDNLDNFVRNLISGQEKLRQLKGDLKKIEKTKKWDGKPLNQDQDL